LTLTLAPNQRWPTSWRPSTLSPRSRAPTRVAVRLGEVGNAAGKTVVVHGAGTSGGAALARLYYLHGTDTIIYIHCAPAEVAKLKQEFATGKNLIVSGHIASDLAGINPFIERLECMVLTVTRVSGL